MLVFRYPGMGEGDPTAGTDYIKRVIGLPGDTISVDENRVSVNGVPFTYQETGVFVGQGVSSEMTGSRIYAESMPNKTHNMLEMDGLPPGYRNNGTWVVPKGIISPWAITATEAPIAASGASCLNGIWSAAPC